MEHDHLTEPQFNRLVDVIQGEVGIRLPPAKRIMVESRLRRRVRALGLPDLAAYGHLVLDGSPIEPQEFVHLIDCVTTNKTDFFREPAHFELLAQRIVPEVLSRRDMRQAPFKVWSAACSTGAEAYTTAMVLDELARQKRFAWEIIGTDISTDVLAQAKRAIYPADMVEPVPSVFRQRYLMACRDRQRPEVRIVPDLRRKVRWARLNLMDGSYPIDNDVDVIVCRNVLIYFDRPTQQQVLKRLCAHLRPGGYLIVGHSESMAGHGHAGMVQVVPTVYRSLLKGSLAA